MLSKEEFLRDRELYNYYDSEARDRIQPKASKGEYTEGEWWEEIVYEFYYEDEDLKEKQNGNK